MQVDDYVKRQMHVTYLTFPYVINGKIMYNFLLLHITLTQSTMYKLYSYILYTLIYVWVVHLFILL